MIRRPPRSTRTDTLFPYTPLFRSVITVSHTVVATVAAIELTGATPVLVDVDHYWTLDPDRLEALLANWPARVPKAKALIPVHLYGQPAAMTQLQRSEEHTSELQSLMRISYAVFCLKKKKKINTKTDHHITRQHNRYDKLTIRLTI